MQILTIDIDSRKFNFVLLFLNHTLKVKKITKETVHKEKILKINNNNFKQQNRKNSKALKDCRSSNKDKLW